MRTTDLTRQLFSVLVLGLLIAGSLWVLKPFLGSMVWAAMVVLTTWPLMLKVQARLGGRRWAAVLVMSLLLLLLFAVPLSLALFTLVDNADRIVQWAKLLTTWQVPATPPAWLANLPLLGDRLVVAWEQAVAAGLAGLLPKLQPYAGGLTRWFVAEVGSVGYVLVQFLLTVALAAVFYLHGEEAARQVKRFAWRLGGDRGEAAVLLAGAAVRGVALGVGVTALVQAVLGGVGLALVGVPLASLLTALMFMLCIAQVGALPVLLPATAWVFYNGDTGWGIFLAVWSLVVGTLDNFLRPVLIRLGADLPLLLIFAGVIGGLVAFGLVGIFVGPVLLAVAYTLLESWLADEHHPATRGPAPGAAAAAGRAAEAAPAADRAAPAAAAPAPAPQADAAASAQGAPIDK
ncbi:MAG: AI-2E family transporter YdiK [Rubrivivax sp.]